MDIINDNLLSQLKPIIKNPTNIKPEDIDWTLCELGTAMILKGDHLEKFKGDKNISAYLSRQAGGYFTILDFIGY